MRDAMRCAEEKKIEMKKINPEIKILLRFQIQMEKGFNQ